MQSPIDFVGLVCHVCSVEKDNCAVRETHSDRIFIWAVLDCQDDTNTGNIFDEPHSPCVIYAHQTQILFVKDYFVNASKVVDLFNKTVMSCFVLYV